MALRNFNSRLWLIPVFAVLLLWGCGEDVGLVDDQDHARVVIEVPAAAVVLNTDFEAGEDGEPDEYTWTVSGNHLDISANNFPRLGDDEIDGGGILAEVQSIHINITDLAGNVWARNPYIGRHVIEPNGFESILVQDLLPAPLEDTIIDRYFLDAGLPTTDADRYEIAEFIIVLTFRIREYTADGHYETTYSIQDTVSATLNHTGDRLY